MWALVVACEVVLIFSGRVRAEGPTTSPTGVLIDGGKYLDRTLADCGFQKAIDAAAAAGGGVVQLPAGRFVMERYLYLRSGVAVRGRGGRTVLAVGKAETCRGLAADVAKGATEIPLAGEPAGLKAGMIVFLWPDDEGERRGATKYYKVREINGRTIVIDKPSEYPLLLKDGPHVSWGLHTYITGPAVKGRRTISVAQPELLKAGYAIKINGKGDVWDHHFNVVTAVEGNTLRLERPLTVEAREGLVQHGFAMITADGEKNIGVSDLVIEGWKGRPNPRWVGLDFVLAGIHAVRCDGIKITNVEIRNWHSDGVSIQKGADAVIDHCSAVNCYGWGFHSGTTFRDAEFTDLKMLGNGKDGFYYCWYNTNVNVRRCLIAGNAGYGIGGMGDPGDRRCMVEANTIERNGLAGIRINGGGEDSGSVIRGNVIRDNSRARPGAWPGIAIYPSGERAQGYLIEKNTITGSPENPTQRVGIEERNGSPVRAEVWSGGKLVTRQRIADRNVIRGNRFAGHESADIIVTGPQTVVRDNGRAKVVRRPDAATTKGASPMKRLGGDVKIVFLHHSTGRCVWNGGVAEWFAKYNAENGTNWRIVEVDFPKRDPYGWKNYPYDYWNIWVNNAGQKPFRQEPTLEMLTKDYDVIVFKHCFPVSAVQPDTGKGDVADETRTLENYKAQYNALKSKLHEFADTRFVVWTGAALVEARTDPDQAGRARRFADWVRNEWDVPDDNIFVWDFHSLETDGGLYLKPAYARGRTDSHPNEEFCRRVAPLLCEAIVAAIKR